MLLGRISANLSLLTLNEAHSHTNEGVDRHNRYHLSSLHLTVNLNESLFKINKFVIDSVLTFRVGVGGWFVYILPTDY